MTRKVIDRGRVACLDCVRLDTPECPRGCQTLRSTVICYAYAQDCNLGVDAHTAGHEAKEDDMGIDGGLCVTCHHACDAGETCGISGSHYKGLRTCPEGCYKKGTPVGSSVVTSRSRTGVTNHVYVPPVKPSKKELLAAASPGKPAVPVADAGIDRATVVTTPAAPRHNWKDDGYDDSWDRWGYGD